MKDSHRKIAAGYDQDTGQSPVNRSSFLEVAIPL
jgi:hypothetical protein